MDTNGVKSKVRTTLPEVGLRIGAHETASRPNLHYYWSRNIFIDCVERTDWLQLISGCLFVHNVSSSEEEIVIMCSLTEEKQNEM
jgi:hypothetical protein